MSNKNFKLYVLGFLIIFWSETSTVTLVGCKCVVRSPFKPLKPSSNRSYLSLKHTKYMYAERTVCAGNVQRGWQSWRARGGAVVRRELAPLFPQMWGLPQSRGLAPAVIYLQLQTLSHLYYTLLNTLCGSNLNST